MNSFENTLYHRILASSNPRFVHSLQLIEKIVQEYGTTGVCLSFNGGKDCTVILHLLFAVISHLKSTHKLPDSMQAHDIKAIYFHTEHQFPEVEQFMQDMQMCYGFELMELSLAFKPALVQLLQQYPIKAIIMGQRRIDPDAVNLSELAPSDADRGWPDFLRVNAVLDWHYADVWNFLFEFQLPYCSLYDKGYTSLGTVLDTNPNPHLFRSQQQQQQQKQLLQQPQHEQDQPEKSLSASSELSLPSTSEASFSSDSSSASVSSISSSANRVVFASSFSSPFNQFKFSAATVSHSIGCLAAFEDSEQFSATSTQSVSFYLPAYKLDNECLERAGRSDAKYYAAKNSSENADAAKLKSEQQRR